MKRTLLVLTMALLSLAPAPAQYMSPYDEVVPGGYKINSGLRRWKLSLGQVGKTSTGTGLGGVDIVVGGDSINEGGRAATYLYDTWPHLLKVRLQDALNPPGVQGGYGYIPGSSGTYNTNWAGCGAQLGSTGLGQVFTFTGASWASNGTTGTAGRRLNATGATHQAYFILDGTAADATQKRLNATKFQFVGANGPTIGTWTWDVVANGTTFVTAGTGNPTGTVTVRALQWGHHWHDTDAVSLTRTSKYLIQATAPASNSIYLDGIIAYDNDFDCGVRLHQVARWGSSATSYNYGEILASLDVFGLDGAADGTTVATNGACRMKLFIANWITNDVGGATIGDYVAKAAAFKTNYLAIIDRALATSSKPAVLLIIPPMNSNWDEDHMATIFPLFVKKVYEIADERDNVAVLNLHRAMGYRPNAVGGMARDLGWYLDGVHYTSTAQKAWAETLFKVLMP